MPRWTPLLTPVLAWSLALNALHAEVQFISRPLPVVKDMAARQGKLFFVHFTAQWCMPCRWMEEHTFTDPALARFVGEHYIAVKMDIDDTYGLKCKEEFAVHLLPTILVFNAQGEIIGRREASLDAGLLLDMLRQHRQQQPSVGMPAGGLPASPPYPQASATRTEHITPGAISRPALLPDDLPPLAQPTVVALTSYGDMPPDPGSAFQPDQGLPFTVQTGVFSDYGNALNEVNRLENLLRRPVNLTALMQNGKTVYKITVGSFSSRRTAEDYLNYLRSKDVSGFVRHADSL